MDPHYFEVLFQATKIRKFPLLLMIWVQFFETHKFTHKKKTIPKMFPFCQDMGRQQGFLGIPFKPFQLLLLRFHTPNVEQHGSKPWIGATVDGSEIRQENHLGCMFNQS